MRGSVQEGQPPAPVSGTGTTASSGGDGSSVQSLVSGVAERLNVGAGGVSSANTGGGNGGNGNGKKFSKSQYSRKIFNIVL